MDLTTVEYEKRGHIAYVTLNRPDKLNAMNAAMHRELGEVWQDFQMDPEIRPLLNMHTRPFSLFFLIIQSLGSVWAIKF